MKEVENEDDEKDQMVENDQITLKKVRYRVRLFQV